MKKRILAGVITGIFAGTLLSVVACYAELPKPAGRVSDFAGVIDAPTLHLMTETLNELERKTSAEIAVVTVKTLGKRSIEEFTVDLFNQWGVGKKGRDNGVLLVAAVEDRRVRIEVGYGLEGILPDGKTGAVLDTYVLPAFREGNYAGGLERGTRALAGVIALEAGVELSGEPLSPEAGAPADAKSLLLNILFLVIAAVVFIRHPFLFLMLLGAGRGGGRGGGGFGGGFGGFGGGRSGGGGASRGW